MNINPKIVIEGKEYKLPSSFTVDQWIELMQYDFENPKDWPKILAFLTEEDPEFLLKAGEDSLKLTTTVIVYKMNQRKEAKGMKDFNTILFGEFIDLDIWIAQGIRKNLKSILNILCPKIKRADEALWVLDQFVNWRNGIFRMYKVLFGIDDRQLDGDGDIDDDDEAYDPMALARNWYAVIVELANWDVLKIDQITDLPLLKALNFMALKKQRAMEELAAIKKQHKKYELQRNRR